MQITVVAEPSIQPALRRRVRADISTALQSVVTKNNQFIVNDSDWYARRVGGVNPCVVNSASFISSLFQKALGTLRGWRGETSINDQNIDGYGEFPENGMGYKIPRESVFKFLDEYVTGYLPADVDLGAVTSRIYGMYVARSIFELSEIPHDLHHFFIGNPVNTQIRVGVEFETGNIASSFRALTKLGNLFSAGKIDAGVFITSINKADCASRIWPVSNRNGSFEELKRRNYNDNISLPLWQIGFAPDGFDLNAQYLGANGTLYSPTPVVGREDVEIDGMRFSEWRGEKGDTILRPKAEL